MKTYSGNTSEGFVPATMPSHGHNGSTAVAPAPEDPKATFTDALKEQQRTNVHAQQTGTPFGAAPADITADSAAATIPTTPAAPTPWTPPTGTTPPLPVTPAAPVPVPPNTTALTPPLPLAPASLTGAIVKKTQLPTNAPAIDDTANPAPAGGSKTLASSDLSVMLARAAMLMANSRQMPATAHASATNSATSTTSVSESDAAAASDDASDTLSILAWGMKPATTPITEKKSANSSDERSFIQSDASASSTLGMMLMAPLALASAGTQVATNHNLPTSPANTGTGSPGGSIGALTSAGTGSVKKENEMNATLDMTDLMTSTGSTQTVAAPSASVHILLGTNNDFKDALAQVMHVAELSHLSTTTPPLRVAIEIQTPPGAVVNVYVSKQPDNTYRAQLGTDDLQALNWVQDQIGSLKQSTDTGVAVRWLPAQLETTSTITTSSSSESGLGWDRGGQQGQSWQSNQQQADDRQQARQKRAGYTDRLAPDLSIPFIGALGRAA